MEKESAMIRLPVGPLEVNCYIIWDEETKDAFIIDPGSDADRIELAVRTKGLNPVYAVNTHGHFDHVGANAALKEALGVKTAIHGKDAELLAASHEHGAIYGYMSGRQPEPDILLKDGDVIKAGGKLTLKVIHTPGHTEGGVCLYDGAGKRLFTGDTLFAGSVGRTDLGGGSFEKLIESLMKKILPLGDDVSVFPGHGPATTIGEEKENNPFITGR